MKITSLAKTKLGLILLSSTVSMAILVGVFETIENIRYYRWRKNFDNFGWFGRITVPSPNPVLMWEYRPYGEFKELKMNRYGFRDRDYDSTAKPENIYRLAFIGDSVTLGVRVSADQTFVRQFEAAANQVASRYIVQALNFAVDGYGTPQIYEMLRTKALDFAPDKVIYVLCLNDFDFGESSGLKILYFRKPRSFLLPRLETVYQRLRGGDYHAYHFRKNKKAVYQNILDMKALLHREAISFQIVVLPVFPRTTAGFADYPLRDMHKEIGEFLRENGIRYVDLLDAFTEEGKPPRSYASDIWHPNAEGHLFIARKLLPSALSH
jgi:lysophospholipase L1-like esterase